MSFFQASEKKSLKINDKEVDKKLYKIIKDKSGSKKKVLITIVASEWKKNNGEKWNFNITLSNYIKKSRLFSFVRVKPGLHEVSMTKKKSTSSPQTNKKVPRNVKSPKSRPAQKKPSRSPTSPTSKSRSGKSKVEKKKTQKPKSKHPVKSKPSKPKSKPPPSKLKPKIRVKPSKPKSKPSKSPRNYLSVSGGRQVKSRSRHCSPKRNLLNVNNNQRKRAVTPLNQRKRIKNESYLLFG